MGFETPKMPTPEEMAKINRERMRSDEKLEAGGAEVKYNEKGEVVDLAPTPEQREDIKDEMENEIERKKRLAEERLEIEKKIDSLSENEKRLYKVFEAINQTEDYAKQVLEQNKNNKAFLELAQRNHELRATLWEFTDRLSEIGPEKGIELDTLSMDSIRVKKEE